MRRRIQGEGGCGLSLVVAAFLLALGPQRLHGEEGAGVPAVPFVEVRAEANRSACRIDQEISYKIVMQWLERLVELEYRIPKLPLQNLESVLVKQSSETRFHEGGRIYERLIEYTLKPVKTGGASVGAFFFEYRAPGWQETQRVLLPAMTFEIRGIPLWALFWFRTLLLALGSAAVLGAAAAAGWSFYRRRGRESPETARQVSISRLEDDAVLELADLNKWLESGKLRDSIRRAGEVFRRYVQKKYELTPGQAGSLELFSMVERRRDIPADEKKKVGELLQRLSESQFAGAEPSREEVMRIHGDIVKFIIGKKVV